MSDIDKKDELANDEPIVEYVLDDFELNPVSSASMVRGGDADGDPGAFGIPEPSVPAFLADDETTLPVDPVFEELSLPVLPDLEKDNRARLQMQSPNRLYFYWSVKNNPYQTLQNVFGPSAKSYRLVARLVDLSTEREVLHPIEPEGNWWYNVEANSAYRVEIGFYAPNRPFVRVMFSNAVETPRKSPSPRVASESDWAITAYEFAEVLDNAGFARDAFEVALAGDDQADADRATDEAFRQLVGDAAGNFNADEVRYALLALASGVGVEALRGQISEALYLLLADNSPNLSAENTLSALKDNFDVLEEEFIEFEESGEAVFGASLVHFPKRRAARTVPKAAIPRGPVRFVPRLSPISSLRF
jgi:hypothetical protein